MAHAGCLKFDDIVVATVLSEAQLKHAQGRNFY